ncbi:putative casein kinase II subunit beta-2 [Phascolomyces articulosus]|uniref:Casein kinase II subunit beta n=1 Tax=Phascolomyces articulosus TaxID=60185 RepID=A0AAD5JX11_9FUNG|nr:putative casein kinase II subunit beta-2 [Phascolomyces articulosus]
MDDDDEMHDSLSTTSSQPQTWIEWFCSSDGHEYYCQVDDDFIEDRFNLTGLIQQVPLYKEALELILDMEREEDEMSSTIPDVSIVQPHAELLYGLIHQRYINTRIGLNQMLDKYRAGDFGSCPRYYCEKMYLLPVGQHDQPNISPVRLYCPNCMDIYACNNKYANVDGAHFGTTFPHLFVKTFSDEIKLKPSNTYVGRIFGFRINEQSVTGPRMQWLRLKPPHSSS